MRHWTKPGGVAAISDSRKPFTWRKPGLGQQVGPKNVNAAQPPTGKIGA
jgi:hypothetical protein